MTIFSMKFPALHGDTVEPLWDGLSFVIGSDRTEVLRYPVGDGGWSRELTELHEKLSNGQHFIDRASRRLAMHWIKRYCSGPNKTIIEIGVSGGHLLRDMQAEADWRIIGADYTFDALTKITGLRERIPLVQLDLSNCPLPDGFVDCVVALNVLEHIERDDNAVSNCFRILKPGGIAIVEAPRGPALYDDYDRELMHFRRYQMSGLVKLFRDQGFHILERTHIGFALYPAFYSYKKASRFLSKSRSPQLASGGKPQVTRSIGLSSAFGWTGEFLMACDNFLRERMYLPFGIRCCIVCRKMPA